MPKDPTESSTSSTDKKVKDKVAKDTLKRNQSCLSCRKRKLRCDAGRPTCATCIRSYNHTLQHLKAGQEPPPFPTCSYEEAPSFSTSSSHGAEGETRKGKVSELEGRIGELEQLLKQAVGIEGLGMLATNATGPAGSSSTGPNAGWGGLAPPAAGTTTQWEGTGAGRDGQPFGTGQEWAGKDTSWMGPNVPNTRISQKFGPYFARMPAESNDGTASTEPSQPTFQSSFDPANPATVASTSYIPNFTFDKPARPTSDSPPVFNFQPPVESSSSSGLAHPQQTTNLPPSSSSNLAQPSPVPAWPFDPSTPSASTSSNAYSTWPAPGSPSASFDFAHNTRRPPFSQEIPLNPTGKRPEFVAIDATGVPGSNEPHRQTSGPTIQEILDETETSPAGGSGGLAGFGLFHETLSPGLMSDGNTRSADVGEGGTGDFGATNQDYFMDLLWPGWPSKLPSPGKLEHIVQSFFDLVPFATEMFSRTRFMTRLSMPPTHKDFPHPAVLHAICCVTARFIGDIHHMAPGTFHPANYPKRRNEVVPVELPKWDGLGTKPFNTTPYIDEDFGEVHFTWAMAYVEQGKVNAAEWYQLVQCLLLLQQYSHQSAKWVQGWTSMAIGARLAIPLGLNARPHSAQAGLKPNRDSLIDPPKDDIERQERANLFWLVFCQDSFASTSSGWQGAIEPRELFLGLPTSHATFPDGFIPPLPSQYGDDEDVLLRNPVEHHNSFSLTVKGTILLRKIGDFIRVADMKGTPNVRSTKEFQELDALVTKFRSSFPPEFMNPLSCLQTGSAGGSKALDHNLVLAHALPFVAILTLHDRYTDSHNPTDPSSPRLYAAARALLGQVYLISSTNFSFTFLHPFMSYVWYLGAKTLIRQLQVALRAHDNLSETSLLQEIGVFSRAIDQLAERLPIGARQSMMLNAILNDVISDPMSSDQFPINNCKLIADTATVKEQAGVWMLGSEGTTPSSTSGATWSLGTPPGSAGTGAGGGGGGAVKKETSAKSVAGAPGHWLAYDQLMQDEMDQLKAPWEGRIELDRTVR